MIVSTIALDIFIATSGLVVSQNVFIIFVFSLIFCILNLPVLLAVCSILFHTRLFFKANSGQLPQVISSILFLVFFNSFQSLDKSFSAAVFLTLVKLGKGILGISGIDSFMLLAVSIIPLPVLDKSALNLALAQLAHK
jgi:hypothetical protein